MTEPVREQGPAFTLVQGGLIHRIATRLPRLGTDRFTFAAILAGCVVFLPMAVLAAVQDVLYGSRVGLPFLPDWSVWVRFAIAVPLLILAERTIDRMFSEAVDQFRVEGVIPAETRSEFESAILRLTRSLDSVLPEMILLALAFGSTWIGPSVTIGATISTWRVTVPGDESSTTLAGHWLHLVSLPVFRFLVLRWFWRIALWTRFLVRVSRMKLQLTPTHPDGAAGLGFLGLAHASLSTILVPLSLVAGSRGVYWVQYGGGTLEEMRNALLAFLLLSLALTLGPLLVFVPKLIETKWRGLTEYATFASLYTQRFDRKWVRGEAPDEEILGSGDIQSLADLGNSYATIRNMRFIPATLGNMMALLLAAALPLLPVLAVIVPFEKILGVLLQLLG